MGKTAALRHMTKGLNPHKYQVIYLSETDFGRLDIYRQLARALGLEPAYRRADLWRNLKAHISDLVEHKKVLPVFIIDESQNLPHEFFRDFPSFLNFAFDSKEYMTVWFIGLPCVSTLLKRQLYEAMNSRIGVRYQLEPVSNRDQFNELIKHAFKDAGAQSTLMSDSGIELLWIATQGRLRHVQGLLMTAMRLAQQKNMKHLPDEVIEQAIEELRG